MKPKDLRRLGIASTTLFSARGYTVPITPADFQVDRFIARQVELAPGKCVLLTDAGMTALRSCVSLIDKSGDYSDRAEYSDIFAASRNVFRECLQKNEGPDDGAEFLGMIDRILVRQIDRFTFVMPIFGIELTGLDRFTIGSLRIVAPSSAFLDEESARYESADLEPWLDAMKPLPWVTGTTGGTSKVAFAKFLEKAHLSAGLLAIVAGADYEGGAHGFRIGIIAAPEQGYGRAMSLSWSEKNRFVSKRAKFPRAQALMLDTSLEERLTSALVWQRCTAIIESATRTQLEESLVQAIYWYSDAHRDEVPVTRVLKYWSCIETFFSSRQGLTNSVVTGATEALCYGPVGFIPVERYESTRKQLDELYELRSRATHDALYRHVSRKDAADLSQLVAWVIVNVAALSSPRIASNDDLKEWLAAAASNIQVDDVSRPIP